jgi:hypothetical protein
MLNGKFRVSSRLPPPAKIPEDFGCLTPEGETSPVCVSPLYETIHEAKGRAAALQADLQAQGCKVLFFFELRPAIVSDPHSDR